MGSEKSNNYQVEAKDPTAVKLSMMQKIGYGMGEAGSTLSFTMISSYLTVFYSDVVGLAPAVISVIMLIARIWQAICDPVFGGIAENTRSKLGRYRPYILYGAPLLALFNCLTFLNLDIPVSAKTIWCTVTYIACCTVYSFANGAVACIVNSLTSINEERVSANAVKGVVPSVFGIIVSAVTMPLIMKFGGGNKKSVKQNQLLMIASSFKNAFKDWNVAWLMIAMIIYLTGIFGRIGVMAYYFIYVLQAPMGIAAFGTAMTAGMLVVNCYTPQLLNKINKKYGEY